MHYDSTGRVITVGSKVKFRGKEYTIKRFLEEKCEAKTFQMEFVEDVHTTEIPCETSIDLIL